ncbi:kinase-like protein [Xylaria longipes]|nr:kinase-like protein [Xylaria longipes]
MATLVVNAPDYSKTKQKALEDAKAMQASIMKECIDSGKDPPPYSFLEVIGKGSFGRVYKAEMMSSEPAQLVAIKVINIEAGDSLYPGATDTFGDILKEINALKLLGTTGAENVNTIIDAHLVGQSMWIVTEYCAGGSVASLMRPTGCLPERWIVPILREVAEAIFWVHKQGIIHRDIKCANVLVTDAGYVQLCDFGVAAIIETKFDKRTTVTGTLQWMAPELLDSSVSYGTEVDIWAFGSMAYEVASGLPPNAATIASITDFSAYLKQHCPRLEGDQYSPLLKDFVSHCMVVDPTQRPTIDIVQKHPYILNTSKDYPTSSLSKLVNAYKLWEIQGGIRRSLFSKGGAQPPTDHHSPVHNEEWTFTTMKDIDHFKDGKADDEAIYDAYHPRISFSSPVPSPRLRRRQPPNIKAPNVPLEKAFDPNTISNYKDAVRAFYGRPPPSSGLSLQDGSNNLPLRTSLIDLDASINGSELLQFADLETIKARAQPLSSDMADVDRRRTQDWTFPARLPIYSALDMAPSQFDSDDAPIGHMRQSTQLYPASNSATDSSAGRTGLGSPCSRISTLSLIDLDASLPSDATIDTQPSTAGSDTRDTPFDLEPLVFKGQPDNREPSLYVSSDASLYSAPQYLQTDPHNTLTNQGHDSGTARLVSEPSTKSGGILAPSLPSPPSSKVMQGTSSRGEVKDELRRMISSLNEQLEFTAHCLTTLPVRRAGYHSVKRAYN